MTITNLALMAYPIGSIYMSVNSTSPATLFGGTWERITGRFLLAATDNGSSGASQAAGRTGGEASVTLGADHLPARSMYSTTYNGTISYSPWYGGNVNGYIASCLYDLGMAHDNAHENMPPFLAVYMWKRTA